ncbi:beta-mannosidase [Kitasatospora herbaricolor]|uniref:cellulase family glycosylhydrolase n=1 Tax=Kitasatospora herbaricolor TaxID=68217 RepID=UPI00174CDA89|nr:cellulase family glycosylhydrolase [Kitasatospora herbaricolor]MDQ0313485.1 mannan endo-1,4-beta-mannosidase [Kitasatospora herbaricolor]GGV43155.1 beta-mannosidase [Kitasatospora herbaricolor]
MEKPPSSRVLTAVGAAVAAVLGLLVSVSGLTAGSAEAVASGIHVSNGRLYEANGNEFVMRGVNHAHAWYPSRTASIADIAAKGANTVRLVLSNGDRWTRTTTSEVSSLIGQCKANKLICVLEVHDTTGYGEDGAATTLDRAAQFWIDNKSALAGQENYVVVNLGNEPFGNTGYAAWTDATKAAIGRLRTAGINQALMADAPNWGQDWSGTMRDNAASVLAADPAHNTVFSVHMYGVYDTAAEVQAYLNFFVNNHLPIVVGEFGNLHSDGNPDEDAIMATAKSLRVGYLGWSWSGNGSGVEYLDLVNGFDRNAPTSWGNRLFYGSDGISSTSKTATVFGATGSPGTSPSPSATTAPNGYPYCASSSSDPDGDGWGWENSRSCVVRGSAADTPSPSATTAPNGYPYCAGGSSDTDGDGWGWENSRSCVVRGSAADH